MTKNIEGLYLIPINAISEVPNNLLIFLLQWYMQLLYAISNQLHSLCIYILQEYAVLLQLKTDHNAVYQICAAGVVPVTAGKAYKHVDNKKIFPSSSLQILSKFSLPVCTWQP